MSKKNEDLHITLLKFGKDHLEFGVTFQQLQGHIKKRGFDIEEKRLQDYFVENYRSLEITRRGHPIGAADEGLRFSLTVDSTFRLIEHEELKRANQSSRIATYFATAALLVSFIAASFSIYFSNKQLESSTKIDQEQFSQILQLEFDGSKLSQSLEEIIEMQKLEQKPRDEGID